ncbi:MAG: hypothetical protein ABJG78_14770 [Cyclobacteriaceae bacterium]
MTRVLFNVLCIVIMVNCAFSQITQGDTLNIETIEQETGISSDSLNIIDIEAINSSLKNISELFSKDSTRISNRETGFLSDFEKSIVIEYRTLLYELYEPLFSFSILLDTATFNLLKETNRRSKIAESIVGHLYASKIEVLSVKNRLSRKYGAYKEIPDFEEIDGILENFILLFETYGVLGSSELTLYKKVQLLSIVMQRGYPKVKKRLESFNQFTKKINCYHTLNLN